MNKELICIYHKGENYTVNQAASMAKDRNIKINFIDVRKEPLTATQLKTLASEMEVELRELVDTKALKDSKNIDYLDDENQLLFLSQNPSKLKTPIVKKDSQVFFLTKPTDLLSEVNVKQNIDPYNH
tara:strand:- start:2690 stop:3070 length:381 start_codon:yes stop_codon:yes gene_type:complete